MAAPLPRNASRKHPGPASNFAETGNGPAFDRLAACSALGTNGSIILEAADWQHRAP